MDRSAVAGLVLITVVAAVISMLSMFKTTRADNAAQQGNVDCYGPIAGPLDVVQYLRALTETSGVPRDCDVLLSTWPPCPTPASPTACVLTYFIPTTSPGEALPARIDVNCDGAKNSLDVLALLRLWSLGGPSPTPCASTRSSDDSGVADASR
jgi:hypothetical protein